MIAKIKMKSKLTSMTLAIDGNDAKRAFTMSRMPSFLDIILRGLNALKARSAFKACN